VKLVCISDTHNKHRQIKIPDCDILISAGDYSSKGYDREIIDFYKWLNEQNANHIVSIQGNHELGWEANPEKCKKLALEHCPAVHLLEDQSINIEGINIYGSAYTPYFYDWAYNAGRTITEAAHYRKPFIGDIWAKIPENTNILVTHGPAYGILDELTYIDGTPKGQFVGCVELGKRINELKELDLHICGHIHCAHGQKHIDGVSYYNASICDEVYQVTNPITIIEYEKEVK
jgi:Icc-related predicted phosphoesterase